MCGIFLNISSLFIFSFLSTFILTPHHVQFGRSLKFAIIQLIAPVARCFKAYDTKSINKCLLGIDAAYGCCHILFFDKIYGKVLYYYRKSLNL